MATRRRDSQPESPSRPPAITPEGRENQLIAAAESLAERQILEGTASSQVITHFLKLGSSREKLEQIRINNENEVLKLKRELMESQNNAEELYDKAIKAMRQYQGHDVVEEEDHYDD